MAQEASHPQPQMRLTSFESLQNVEKRIVGVVELIGSTMEEIGSPTPRLEAVSNLACQVIDEAKAIQSALKEEIGRMSEYRPYENSLYLSRTGAELRRKEVAWAHQLLTEVNRLNAEVNPF
eukprot:TRINITY_DN16550_c0_g3_i1.p1 TRINITY_DN16550_c0_g3~~TRINITY_DN16550_c0_g3_i1.p1  ORF type:complete len:121 (-),score=27.52 TRINITY_DN16550_c0_g3_i1:23-385(-)